MSNRRLALLSAAVIALADATIATRTLSRPKVALLDEPAHAATTLLALAALSPPPSGRARRSALVASALLDADHVPSELGFDVLRRGAARPYAHTALGAALAAAVAKALGGSPAGAAFGVGAHLVRDLATGPGITLGWPLSHGAQRMSPWLYRALVAVTAARVALRRSAAHPPRRGRGSRP